MLTSTANPVLFYESREGRAARDVLRFHVEKLLGDAPAGLRTLSLGAGQLLYDGPTSAARLSEAHGGAYSCFVDAANKPLPDDDFDRVIALHACPLDGEAGALMIEARRVLKGQGRLILVLPRAQSRWSSAAGTPFANERGYSARQILKMLRDRGLYLTGMRRALYLSPSWIASKAWPVRSVERFSSTIPLPFGGSVFVVEAEKRQCATARCGARTDRSVFMPVSLPQLT